MSQSHQWTAIYKSVLKETGDEDAAVEAADTALAEQEGKRDGKRSKNAERF